MTDRESPQQRPGDSRAVRLLLQGFAVLNLVLAVIGTLLPIMPTVPFVLLAAWAAARSSPRLAAWLETHPRFGRSIREWRQGGVVRRPVKWATTGSLSFGSAMILWIAPNPWLAAGGVAVMFGIGVWIWRRPESVPSESQAALPED